MERLKKWLRSKTGYVIVGLALVVTLVGAVVYLSLTSYYNPAGTYTAEMVIWKQKVDCKATNGRHFFLSVPPKISKFFVTVKKDGSFSFGDAPYVTVPEEAKYSHTMYVSQGEISLTKSTSITYRAIFSKGTVIKDSDGDFIPGIAIGVAPHKRVVEIDIMNWTTIMEEDGVVCTIIPPDKNETVGKITGIIE